MQTRRFGPIALTLLILITALIIQTPLIALFPQEARVLFSENQIVEQMTVYLWLAAAVAAVIRAVRHERERRLDFLLLAALFLVLGARELDLNKHVFDWNLTRFVNYRKAYIPVSERLTAFAAILLPIGVALGTLFFRNVRPVWRAVRLRAPWSQLVVFWIALMVVARIADKVAQAVHVEVPHLMLMGIEETSEATLAMYSLLAVAMTAAAARKVES